MKRHFIFFILICIASVGSNAYAQKQSPNQVPDLIEKSVINWKLIAARAILEKEQVLLDNLKVEEAYCIERLRGIQSYWIPNQKEKVEAAQKHLQELLERNK